MIGTVLFCLFLTLCGGNGTKDVQPNHKLEKRQAGLTCFSGVEIVPALNQTRCTGERLGVMATVEECCQPRSIGGLEGRGYTIGGSSDCSPCPSNVSTDVEIRCYSGESCGSESFSLVSDIQSCCLLDGERWFTIERTPGSPGECLQCVVLQWVDSPRRAIPESFMDQVISVEYTKGANVGFTNNILRAQLNFITADENDVFLNDAFIELGSGDFSVSATATVDSLALEIDDAFQLVLEPLRSLAPNEILLSTLEVVITDGDVAQIRLTEEDYRLTPEDNGPLMVVVEVISRIASPVSLKLTAYNFTYIRNEIDEGRLELSPVISDEVEKIEDPQRPTEAKSGADFDDTPILFEVDSNGDFRAGIPVTPDDIYEANQNFIVLLELANQSFADIVSIDRRAAVCRIVDDDFIALTWEQPSYTFFESLTDESSVFGPFDPPVLIKQNGTLTEYLLVIYVQPRSIDDDSPFNAMWRDTVLNMDNDFAIGTLDPDIVRFIPPGLQRDEIVIDIFSDNLFNEGVEVAGLDFVNSANRPAYLQGAYPITRLVIFDRNLTVGFSRASTVVSEGVGSFELCAMIFMPELSLLRGPFQIANPFTLNMIALNGTAGPLDYVEITGGEGLLRPFETDDSTHVQCFNVTIRDDTEFESTESFSIHLSLNGSIYQSVVVEPSVSVVEIVDNDAVRIGFEMTDYTVNESEDEVTLTVSILEGASSSPVSVLFSTVNNTALGVVDYNDTEVVLHLHDNNDSVNVTVRIISDSVVEADEQFTGVLTLLGPMQFSDRIVIEPDTAIINILDTSGDDPHSVNVTRVNDTVIADPLFTVPLRVTNLAELGLDQDLSLCYEVHGDPDRYFNLVSDICTSVNAHYTNVSVFNVIDSIAVRAVDEEGRCQEVFVSLEDSCSASVDGVMVETAYNQDGVSVRRYPGSRVRVSVPNCAHLSLVMWIICQNDTLRGYDIDDNLVHARATMLKFVIARGFNLQERSHGLIGQFWNIPITIALVNDTPPDASAGDTYYSVTVTHPDSAPRTFQAFYYPRTWEVVRDQNDPCLYAGGQHGDNTDSSDSVIQGLYTDYVLAGPFDTDYQYSKFDSNGCQ